MDDASRARELHGTGRLDAAEGLYRTALLARPDDLLLRRDYAILLMQSRREAESAVLIDRPDVLARADAEMLSILAVCLRATGKFDRAFNIATRIVEADPSASLGWLMLGSLQMQRGEAHAAEAALRRCIAIEPDLAEAWHYLGESLHTQGRWDEAITAYQMSSRQQPSEIFNIAICHELAGRILQATAGYEAAHRLMPHRADVLARLAQTRAAQCQSDAEAAATTRLAGVLDRPLAWDDAPEPFILSFLDIDDVAKATLLRRHAKRIHATATPMVATGNIRSRADARIRIGYLSADFDPHAVGELVRAHFAAHDRSRFHVSGYSLKRHAGSTADEIRRGFDAFIDCETLADQAIADAIRSDGIDVLIDMAGFTHGARPVVLARRPAPLQLGWLGFIHGHNAPWLDALLVDEYVLPSDLAWPYEDKVVHLEGSLFPGSPITVGKPDRARFDLPGDVPLLASFNNAYKLDATLIRAWGTILQRSPEAHMAVYLPDVAREGFLTQWPAIDAPRERLHIIDKLPIDQQSARAASCDLLLDAFRYQGGATSMSALGSGLPILALAGRSPLARLSAGLNRFLGLEELTCDDMESYISRAASLANDPSRLRQLRPLVQERVVLHGLFNPRRAAAAIEHAIEALLER
ncbi:MAG: tetratricopeptide repeat protein [Luteimonas sp.]|nr:tetratricopeptide repeat protein [Luteimonas sp.]